MLFYFTADGRIDFRELVKDLAAVFKTRIELRQIGVRDETKIVGGIGICGRSLCCHSYLSEFAPVSIKMAKEQNLSLNPTKISGVCGRLMCCLKNEEDTYEYLNSRLPSNGEMVTVLSEGVEGTVNSVNVLRQLVKVVIKTDGDEIEIREYPVEELDFGPDRKPPVPVEKRLLPETAEKRQRPETAERRQRPDPAERRPRSENADRRQRKAPAKEKTPEEMPAAAREAEAQAAETDRQNGEKQSDRRRRPYRRRKNQDAKRRPEKKPDGEKKNPRPREKQ